MLEPANMTHETKYIEVRSWYKRNMDQLPHTLDGYGKYYMSVSETAQMYMDRIDNQIEIHGDQIKRSAIATAAKANLIEMWKDLQDENAWNLPMCKTQDQAIERKIARNKFRRNDKA